MKTEKDNVPAWVKEFRRKEEEFWQRTYPAMAWEGKVKHWMERIEEMMKAGASSGADAYEGFNPLTYAEWKQQEPRIDEILDSLPDHVAGFDSGRMWEGIRRKEEG